MPGPDLGQDFEILGLVRRSLFGDSYRGRQKSLGREVVLRLLEPQFLSESSLRRFLADCERLIGLNHPHVVQFYSIESHQGRPFVVMEYFSGRLFAEMFQAPGFSPRTRLRIMTQVARGLGAIHSRGVVHRGLSPSGVRVGDAGVKISDLGLSGSPKQSTYASQEWLGDSDADYMSPEQIQGYEVTQASDVFAFGVMLYKVLTGHHPFPAEHPMALLNKIIHGEPASLSARAPDLPLPLERLVLRCLDKSPDRRPPNMEGVADELSTIERAIEVETSAQGTTLGRPHVPNPYGKKVMIRAREGFFGRRQEVERIYARLNADPPESVAIVGDRKIGKSSLLNYIYMRANRDARLRSPETMIMVFLDLQQETLWTQERFTKVLLEMIGLETENRIAVADCSLDLGGIRRAVERLHGAGYRLTVILDEFERITSNPEFPLEFFAFLRSLAQHYNVAFLTSSARDLQTLCHDQAISDSPFFNVFSSLRLGVFTPEEARELIRLPSERAGHPLEPHRDAILELSGRFPFFLQLASSLVFEFLADGSQPDWELIRSRFLQEAEPHFRAAWDGSPEAERSVLRGVAQGKRIPEAEQHVLQELIARGYVESDQAGTRLSVSAFGGFITRRAETGTPGGNGRRRRGRRQTLILAGAGILAAVGVSLVVFPPGRNPRSPSENAGLARNTNSSPPRDEQRGRAVSAPIAPATVFPLYQNSYALIIGVGKYTQGWPQLPNVETDVREVAAVLEEHGFQVERVENPDSEHLRAAFKNFIDRRGLEEPDRLLFYFAGHGHTVRQTYGEEMGYIVPTDAPDATKDPAGFLAKAMSMDQIATYARAIQSRHALFVFDACFAGSIFTQSRSGPGHIAFKMESPVRQFITSGDANETVPDRSMFRREFVAGLRGEADQNGDHYITGSELGEFLLEKVVQYTNDSQHPRQGKLRDPNLDKGDFVFALPVLDKVPGQ